MVARLTRTLGSRHLTLAEDAVQDALITALQQWPFRGIPDQPEAWLFHAAKNRAKISSAVSTASIMVMRVGRTTPSIRTLHMVVHR